MSYTSRDYDNHPWVADNGLRVEKRTSTGFVLTWTKEQDPIISISTPLSEADLEYRRIMNYKHSLQYEKAQVTAKVALHMSRRILDAAEKKDGGASLFASHGESTNISNSGSSTGKVKGMAAGPSKSSSFTSKGNEGDLEASGSKPLDIDGLDGPWHEVQMRKGLEDEWVTVYKGYRKRLELKDLVPDAILYFRMRTNNEEWGSQIIAATDSLPPYAEDIHRAVACNAEDMVLRIIGASKGVHLRKLLCSHDCHGMTPLMMACRNGSVAITNILIKAGAWTNAPSFTTRRTALMYACVGGNVRVLELLDKAGVDFLMQDNLGCNALHHSIIASQVSSLKFILSKCGSKVIEEKDKCGWTPLLRAICIGSDIEVVKHLLLKGAMTNVVDNNNLKTPLIAAVLRRNKEILDLLLEYGADPTYKNSLGKTAYDIASNSEGMEAKQMSASIVKALTDMARKNSAPH